MDVIHHQQAAREAYRVQANREELVERIRRAMCEDGTIQPLQGLYLSRSSWPLKPLPVLGDDPYAIVLMERTSLAKWV